MKHLGLLQVFKNCHKMACVKTESFQITGSSHKQLWDLYATGRNLQVLMVKLDYITQVLLRGEESFKKAKHIHRKRERGKCWRLEKTGSESVRGG